MADVMPDLRHVRPAGYIRNPRGFRPWVRIDPSQCDFIGTTEPYRPALLGDELDPPWRSEAQAEHARRVHQAMRRLLGPRP